MEFLPGFSCETPAVRHLINRDCPFMRFQPTIFDKAWILESEPHHDERGFFVRTFCEREFAAQGLCTRFVQHSSSYSRKAGTIRGMHFQRPPHAETKLVRCAKGEIWDVIIDLRQGSATHGQWQGFTLTENSRTQLYIPPGFAHGFQALTNDVEVAYLISEFYAPEAASGVRFDDAKFEIKWPLPVTAISDRDRNWPDYSPSADGVR